MNNKRNEQRMMWLMTLMIVGVSTWFFELKPISYVCLIACVMSVMHYADSVEKPMQQLAEQQHQTFDPSSKAPLYIAATLSLLGMLASFPLLTGIGLSLWIFFFLRWLQRLERNLFALRHTQQHHLPADHSNLMDTTPIHTAIPTPNSTSPSLFEQIHTWVFQGNPVLKAAIAILVIGVILLLRFATEHWQLSLGFKLAALSAGCMAIVAAGYLLSQRNQGVGLGLQGLGIASLFITLFFAYDQAVIATLGMAIVAFIVIQVLNIGLSLKQRSLGLAVMAMVAAYLAPLTVPQLELSTTQLLTYYLAVNVAVAMISAVQPWKVLNQMAFLATLAIGSASAVFYGIADQKTTLSLVMILHSLLFAGVGLRFSNLMAEEDPKAFHSHPIVDSMLIYVVPLSAFLALYLLYFNEQQMQIMFSALYAVIYGLVFLFVRQLKQIKAIAEHYLNVMLIFMACIPPILLHEQWSVLGWAIEGAAFYAWALLRHSLGRLYLAQVFLTLASGLALYYSVSLEVWPEAIFATLGVIYLAIVMMSQSRSTAGRLQNAWSIVFLSVLAIYANVSLIAFFHTQIEDASIQFILSIALVTAIWFPLNELVQRRDFDKTWCLIKNCAISSLLFIQLIFVFNHVNQLGWIWVGYERWILLVSALLQVVLWLRPQVGIQTHKAWVSLGVLISLMMASLSLWSGLPYLSMIMLPVAFCYWCIRQQASIWQPLGLSKMSLVLIGLWLLIAPQAADSVELFYAYVIPLLNPFDLLSLVTLAIFLWMVYHHDNIGKDHGLWAFVAVVGILWTMSQMMLRGLHHFMATPYQGVELWQNSTVQLSLTTLWVVLAWAMMWLATLKHQRMLWILGSSILVLVTLKLVVFDLAHIGTLTRVMSFLLAGGVMLLIAYLAPMPEKSE